MVCRYDPKKMLGTIWYIEDQDMLIVIEGYDEDFEHFIVQNDGGHWWIDGDKALDGCTFIGNL